MIEPNANEKVAVILNDLAINYNEFLKQAKTKLYKQKRICDVDAYKELVSDVMFSVIQKLNNITDIDRFYKMTLQDKLKLYILKGISTNSSFYSAPFLQKKLKETNRLQVFDNYDYPVQSEEDENEILLKEIKENALIADIKSMLEMPRAKEIFGDEYKYYSMLFKEYVSTGASYQTLAIKYNIPKSSIAFHIRIVKEAIRKELNKENN